MSFSLRTLLAPYKRLIRAAYVIGLGMLLVVGGQNHGYPIPDETLMWGRIATHSFALFALTAYWFDRVLCVIGTVLFIPIILAIRIPDLIWWLQR